MTAVTTNVGANQGTVPARAQEIAAPKEGVVVVTLFDVDPFWLDNYRKEINDDALQQLVGSIEEASKKPYLGIKQTVIGCWDIWNADKKQVDLVAGFCRICCAFMVALRPLIKKYNETFGYKAGDEKFIAYNGTSKDQKNRSPGDRIKAFLTIRETGGEWMTDFDAALRAWKLNVNLRDYGEDETKAKALAMLDNLDENMNRTDPSIMDHLNRIQVLIDGGASAREVANRLGMTEGVVSTYRKIKSVPDLLRERFQSQEMEDTYKDVAERQKIQAIVETAIGEFERRLKEPKGSPEVIGISHAKNFCFVINNPKKHINVKELYKLLRSLVMMGDDGKVTTKDTLPLDDFNKKIEHAIQATKLPEEAVNLEATTAAAAAAATATVTGTTPATPATVPVAPVAPAVELTVEQLAIKQAAEKAAATVADGLKSSDAQKEAELKQLNAATAPAVVPPVVATPPLATVPPVTELTGTDDLEIEDEMAVEDMIGDVTVSGDLKAAAAVAKPADASNQTGQTKGKTVESSSDKYKRIPDEKVEANGNAFVRDLAASPDSSIIDVASYLLAATEDFFMLGMTAQYNTCNKAAVEFGESCNAYLKELEDFVTKKGTDEEKALLFGMKPKYTPPSLI